MQYLTAQLNINNKVLASKCLLVFQIKQLLFLDPKNVESSWHMRKIGIEIFQIQICKMIHFV
jgi:hypothetical protein